MYFADKAQKLRDAALSAVSSEDIKAIIKKLVKQAKAGDIRSAREVLDRCLGKTKEVSEGGRDIPTSEIILFEEVMQYVSTVQKLAPLDGIDMKSIEGSSQVLKMG